MAGSACAKGWNLQTSSKALALNFDYMGGTLGHIYIVYTYIYMYIYIYINIYMGVYWGLLGYVRVYGGVVGYMRLWEHVRIIWGQ